MKDITLPSGAILKITLSPFALSKALHDAVLEEMKTLQLHGDDELGINLYKDLFCTGFSSKKVDAALNECMKRSLYNDVHITPDTFEPEHTRQDYLSVRFEVAYANIAPFMRNLTQLLARIRETSGISLLFK